MVLDMVICIKSLPMTHMRFLRAPSIAVLFQLFVFTRTDVCKCKEP